jgi:hypothetical protein
MERVGTPKGAMLDPNPSRKLEGARMAGIGRTHVQGYSE